MKKVTRRAGAKSRACASPEVLRAKKLDKYYTNPEIARLCVNLLKPFVGSDTLLIEPSAGGGAFLDAIDQDVIGLDIAPDADHIIERDFLSLPPVRQPNVAIIGNPPYGKRWDIAARFLNHALEIAGTVGFILPIPFQKWFAQNRVNKGARLVLDHPLPDDSFTMVGKKTKPLRTTFQVWTMEDRWPDLRLKAQPPRSHPDFEITRSDAAGRRDKPKTIECVDWDFALMRTGGYDFSTKVWSANELKDNVQYMMLSASSPDVLRRLLTIDYPSLARRTTCRLAISQEDVYEAYEAIKSAESGVKLHAANDGRAGQSKKAIPLS